MLELANEQIAMGQKAADKAEALRLLADRLVADGLVADGYLQGLQAREAQGSTFLGQGIAIPHGKVPSISRAAIPAMRKRGPSAHQTGPSPSQTWVGVQVKVCPAATTDAARSVSISMQL